MRKIHLAMFLSNIKRDVCAKSWYDDVSDSLESFKSGQLTSNGTAAAFLDKEIRLSNKPFS